MKHRALTAIALCLVASQLSAQSSPPPADKPVEQTQAPEDKATGISVEPAGALPAPSPAPVSGTTASATPAAKKPPAWDVSKPRGLKTREVRLQVDEGSWRTSMYRRTAG